MSLDIDELAEATAALSDALDGIDYDSYEVLHNSYGDPVAVDVAFGGVWMKLNKPPYFGEKWSCSLRRTEDTFAAAHIGGGVGDDARTAVEGAIDELTTEEAA